MGIDHRYCDAQGRWHDVSAETLAALRTAMGAGEREGRPERESDGVMVLREGEHATLQGRAELELEAGEILQIDGALPHDLPAGYHWLRSEDGAARRVIVAPRRCYLPSRLHTWGWALQLYALRSRQSWGMGDLADLREFAEWSARDLGAGVVMLNPLGAATPGLPQNASPYFPSSRRFRNPLYLRIEEIEGARELGQDLERLDKAGRALNEDRIIDRDSIYRLKMAALEMLWARFGANAEFDDYRAREGDDLRKFARFCVLTEQYGRGWQRWPQEFRHPAAAGVGRVAAQADDRVRFYMWMQWQLDRQLARASEPLAIMQDLPIGVDPDGADAWLWQDILAQNVSVGAPPDEFNTKGQDWGLPPFAPRQLRAAGYEPFIRTIRAGMRHAGGLRIDHVMGLFRLYWIPVGKGPRRGAYVRYNADEMLAIVALESHRARAFVVGEDLGTVEDGVREKLAANGVLSYRLLWFEETAPSRFPVQALAAVSTHDLPTIAGVWTGSDVEAQKRIGMQPNEEGQAQWQRKLREMVEDIPHPTVADVVVRAYESLATAPSRILTASVEDALGVEERPNMPATLNDQWPNWSLALPLGAEEIRENELAVKVARAVSRGRGR